MVRIIAFFVFMMSFVFVGISVYAQNNLSSNLEIEDDVYISGFNVEHSIKTPRDLFASGFSVIVSSKIAKDAHIAGFDIDVDDEIGEDLYAAGASVSIKASVGQDLTASGFSVRIAKSALVKGNARLAAGKMTINAPLSGSLVAAGGEIVLNAPVMGDVRITGGEISFGSDAKIFGTLNYSAPEEVDIPSTVISPERVTFTELTAPGVFSDLNEAIDGKKPSIWAVMFGITLVALITLAFFLTVAAVFFAFKPEMVESLRSRTSDHLGKSFLFGLAGMAFLYGLVLVGATTIVGLPLIPFMILAIIIFWVLSYLLGTYVVFWRVADSIGINAEKTGTRLLVIGGGLIILALVNMMPIIGWLVNLSVVLIGMGAITILMLRRSSTIRAD